MTTRSSNSRTSGSEKPRLPRLLTDLELANLLGAAESPTELALISLMICTGLRFSEVPQLDIDCMVRRLDGTGLIYIPSGARHTGRLIPIPPVVREAIDADLAHRGADRDGTGALFVNDQGCRLSRNHAGLLVLRIMARARIKPDAFVYRKGGSLHFLDVFTFSFAERHLREGGTFVLLGRCLGHRSASSTRRLAAHLAAMRLGAPDRLGYDESNSAMSRGAMSSGAMNSGAMSGAISGPISQILNGSGMMIAEH